ncbi:uncharacterized protein SCHCODRAFT_02614728, partial [Schizophyllum commune H4-8]|uniref:uncharacterized protein n=1 Tax=Schizophyllum commune (strain H4-8 / FGSC 9210) TaxID=578458 RepID=UPI00215DFBA7
MEIQETIAVTEIEVDEPSIPAEDDALDEEETQETAPADDGEEPIEESAPLEGSAPTEEVADPKGKKKRKAPAPEAEREPGKTLLPFTRVQKIIKADKEIQMIARDATFLISLAAEEFIRRFVQAGQRVAEREKRATVQHRDLATVVRKADEFIFLEEIIPWTSPDPAPKRGKKKKEDEEAKKNAAAAPPTILDTFVGARSAKETAGREDNGTGSASSAVETQGASITGTPAPASAMGDIVMTEDGTVDQHDSD